MAKIGHIKILGEFLTNYREKRTDLNASKVRKLNEDLITRPNHNVNMLIGLDRFESRRPYGNNLTGILEYISAQLGDAKDLKSIVDAEFVTRRNFLVKVAESAHVNKGPNSFDAGFSCLCCKFNGVIFIWELNTKRNVHQNTADQVAGSVMQMNQLHIDKQYSQLVGNKPDAGDERSSRPTADQQRSMYVGKKFETYVTLDRSTTGAGADVNEVPSSNFDSNVVYRCIFTSPTHGSFKIMFSNEEKAKDMHGKYIELTTCNVTKNWRNELRYYLRSAFTGQTRLIVGECKENYLRSIKEINPMKSPQAIQNGTLALNYLSKFLADLKYQMDFFPEGTFLRFTRMPRDSNYIIQHLSTTALYSYKRYVEEFLDLIANHNS